MTKWKVKEEKKRNLLFNKIPEEFYFEKLDFKRRIVLTKNVKNNLLNIQNTCIQI